MANDMGPDKTAPKGTVGSEFIVFAFMIKSGLKYIWICWQM